MKAAPTLGGEFCLCFIDSEYLLFACRTTCCQSCIPAVPAFLSLYTANDSFDAQHQLFHTEWLGDVIIGYRP